jgi:DNA-binding NarL/FixJ family response regulator
MENSENNTSDVNNIDEARIATHVAEFAKLYHLSKRESELLGLLAKNITASSAIAEALGVSVNTVNNHFKNIHPKSGTSSKPELLCTFFLFCLGKEQQSTQKFEGHSLNVLLVDDDADDRYIVREAQKEKGLPIELHEVASGDEVFQYLRKEGSFNEAKTPDVILLDIMMPVKNGFEVLKELKADAQLKSVPVVILSTYISEDDVAKAYSMGASTYFHKPDSIDKMAVLLENLYRFFIDASHAEAKAS